MAKILNPILLIMIADPEPEPGISGENKGYNGLGIHKKIVASGGGIANIEADLNPKLGGNLNVNNKNVNNLTLLSFKDGQGEIEFLEDISNL